MKFKFTKFLNYLNCLDKIENLDYKHVHPLDFQVCKFITH